jgi:hypothetical protein
MQRVSKQIGGQKVPVLVLKQALEANYQLQFA